METWTNQTDAAVDEKLGIVAVKFPLVVEPREGSKMATLRYALTFTPPELAELGLPLIKRDLKERADCGYEVMFSCEGHFNPDTADGEEFSLDGTTSDDEIESHPEIEMLVQKYFPEGTTLKQARNADGHIIFPATLTVNGEEIANPLAGTKTFFVPGIVWTRTTATREFPESLARQLGCLGTPPVGRDGQRPPKLDGKRDWIMARLKADWRGNIWKWSESWLMSGPNGATPDIYRYR